MIVIKDTQDKVLSVLQAVSGIVERRHTLPILANVMIRKTAQSVQLTTSDLEIQIRTTAELGGDDGDFTTTIGARKLIDILRSMPADQTVSLVEPAQAPGTPPPAYAQSNSFLFDPVYYLLDNPDLVPVLAPSEALPHYLNHGAGEGRTPNGWFDAAWYANRWDDLRPLNLDAATLFQHYNLFGVWEGRAAGPAVGAFDGNRYLADNPDVAAYVDAFIGDFLGSRTNGAIAHYVIYGAAEGRVGYDSAGGAIDLGFAV